MKKTVVFVLIALFILTTTMLVLGDGQESEISYEYSWTKAICSDNNYCQDYEIFCKNNNILSISPITGAAIQFSQDWEDPRTSEFKNKFC